MEPQSIIPKRKQGETPETTFHDPRNVNDVLSWLKQIPPDFPLGLHLDATPPQTMGVVEQYLQEHSLPVPPRDSTTPTWVLAYETLIESVRPLGVPTRIPIALAWKLLENLMEIAHLYGFEVQENPDDPLHGQIAHQPKRNAIVLIQPHWPLTLDQMSILCQELIFSVGGDARCDTLENGHLQIVVEGLDEKALLNLVRCLKEFRFIATIERTQERKSEDDTHPK